MTAEIYQMDDHYAHVCECGCVDFNLLKSHKIECSECQKQFWYWDMEVNDEIPSFHSRYLGKI